MAKNTNWRNQKRDPHTGRWIDALPGDAGNPNISTMGPVSLIRTNAKPDQSGSRMNRPVDLPQFDVQAVGESLGTVHAALSKPRHVTQGGGQTRVWYSRRPGGRSEPHASKEGARDSLLRDVNHEHNIPTGNRIAKDQEIGQTESEIQRLQDSIGSVSGEQADREGLHDQLQNMQDHLNILQGTDAASTGVTAWMDESGRINLSGSSRPEHPWDGATGTNAARFVTDQKLHMVGDRVTMLDGAHIGESGIITQNYQGSASGSGGSPFTSDVVLDSGTTAFVPHGNMAQEGSTTAENVKRRYAAAVSKPDGKNDPEALTLAYGESAGNAARMAGYGASTDKNEAYRAQVRKTFQSMSDEALGFQDATVRGGIDREELDKEINRRVFDGGKRVTKSMDLDIQYYEAAFASVEGQLQRRGMNTLNSSDETLRALDRAEKAATKIPDRGKLNDDAFAIPETRSYPIPDEEHGKLALGRCKGRPEEDRVRAAVIKKFPHLKDYAAKVLDNEMGEAPDSEMGGQ